MCCEGFVIQVSSAADLVPTRGDFLAGYFDGYFGDNAWRQVRQPSTVDGPNGAVNLTQEWVNLMLEASP